MKKRTLATIIMLVGIVILALQLMVFRFDGTIGLIFTAAGTIMAIAGVVALFLFNLNRPGNVENTIDAGMGILDIILEIFFGI